MKREFVFVQITAVTNKKRSVMLSMLDLDLAEYNSLGLRAGDKVTVEVTKARGNQITLDALQRETKNQIQSR